MHADAAASRQLLEQLLTVSRSIRAAMDASDVDTALAAIEERTRLVELYRAALAPAPGSGALLRTPEPVALQSLLAELLAEEPGLLEALQTGCDRLASEISQLEGISSAASAYGADETHQILDLCG